jgi:hypothetical protein
MSCIICQHRCHDPVRLYIERRHFNDRIAEGEQRVTEKRAV